MVSGKYLELSIMPMQRHCQISLFFFFLSVSLFFILNVNIPLYFKCTEYRVCVTKHCETCLFTCELPSLGRRLAPKAVYGESQDLVLTTDPVRHCPLVGKSGHSHLLSQKKGSCLSSATGKTSKFNSNEADKSNWTSRKILSYVNFFPKCECVYEK